MGQVALNNVWKIYPNGFPAVKGISARFEDGEFISLLGPSGCGKTSTLRMIAGLESVTRGEVYIDKILINDLEPGDRNIAMAFESYALYPHLSVYENIAYPLRIRKQREQEIARQVKRVCQSLGIAQFMSDYPSALSGGVQQRTGLARALVRQASLYLLDEVLSHLDALERTMLRGEIRRVQKLLNLTALFVTHDQLEALAMSDRIMVMDDGLIQQIGTPEQIYDTPENLFVAGFVGEPPMNTIQTERIREDGMDFLVLAGQKIRAQDLKLKWLPEAETFITGIRPKNVVLQESGSAGCLNGRVHTFEHLGDYTLFSLKMASGDLLFVIGAVDLRLRLDEPVNAALNPEKVLFYDPHTTNRMLGNNGSSAS